MTGKNLALRNVSWRSTSIVIVNLPVYPLKYHDDNCGIYSRAVELGKRLVQLPTHSFREINARASRRDDDDRETVRLFFCNSLPLLS